LDKNNIVIRRFEAKDRKSVRAICCETAFIGKPCLTFFDGEEIFADALTTYFTDYEPESSFVAELEGKVIGYLTGAKNVAILNEASNARIYPRLFFRAFTKGVFLRKKNLIFIYNVLSSALKGEFKAPDFSGPYPATLHINIRDGFRGQGVGAKLISIYLDYLVKEKVSGVHSATMSEAGNNFFNKLAFELLHRSNRSYFRYILNSDIAVSIYGKRLVT